MSSLDLAEIVIAIFLVIFILMQQRATGLGGAFGGESAVFYSRRGPEKFIFIVSIILAFAFVILALLNVVI